MKPGWMIFWLCASALAAESPLTSPASVFAGQRPLRHNELQLARLRPGRSRLSTAVALYGTDYRRVDPDSGDLLAWVDPRLGRVLRVEVGSGGVLQSVSLSAVDSLLADKRRAKQASLAKMPLATGRGLSLGDPCPRVVALYGEPDSRGPSTESGRELELFFYAFDWAGSDVPQVMEVTCDRATGRVVEITLAAASL